MPNNVETQHKHNIGSLYNIALRMTRSTCIVTSQVFVKKHSIELLPFKGARKHL